MVRIRDKKVRWILANVFVAHEFLVKTIFHDCLDDIDTVSNLITDGIKAGSKIFVVGNEESVFNSQYFVQELSNNKSPKTQLPIFFLNSHDDNDSLSEKLKSLVNPGDIFIVITADEISENISRSLEICSELNIITIGLTGFIKCDCEYLVSVISDDRLRIQEMHIMIMNLICELVENQLFGGK
jgi:D-sedoheptulose 7-phosphate isomerase